MRPFPQNALTQNEGEFVRLLQLMKFSTSMLEIGSRYGASLMWFAANMMAGSRVVSIDIMQCPDVKEHITGDWLREVCQELSGKHDVHLLEGNSHDSEIVERARSLGPYDFIFIDGDHSAEGVRADWENYGHMGKVVAFHDIALPDVAPLWMEIIKKRRTVDFIQVYGIGVVLP